MFKFRNRSKLYTSKSTSDTQSVSDERTSPENDPVQDDAPEQEHDRALDDAPSSTPESAPSDDNTPASTHASDSEQPQVTEPSRPKRPNGYQRALENELTVLEVIHKFGWVTSSLLSFHTWGRFASKMGRITLKRLHDKGLVLRRMLGNGQMAYVLSSPGAQHLTEYSNIIDRARSGKDIRLKEWYHRYLSNLCLVVTKQQAPYCRIYTEHEISTGRVPFLSRNRMGRSHLMRKVPDGLIHAPGDGRLVWIEVENARRKTDDMNTLIDFLRRAFSVSKIAHNVTLYQVYFVLSAENKSLMYRLARSLEYVAHGAGPEIRMDLRIIFVVFELSYGLVYKTFELYTLRDVLHELEQKK